MVDKYLQIKKYQLFVKIYVFISTLYEFLNEKFELKELFNDYPQFEISYSYFRKHFLRKLEQYAADSCGVVCPSYGEKECDGHRTLKYLQKYEEFMLYNVEERNVFYKNISVIKNGKNTGPLMGYIFIPKDMVDLRGKSWSQKLSYLN